MDNTLTFCIFLMLSKQNNERQENINPIVDGLFDLKKLLLQSLFKIYNWNLNMTVKNKFFYNFRPFQHSFLMV
jgi:hypothetical protein